MDVHTTKSLIWENAWQAYRRFRSKQSTPLGLILSNGFGILINLLLTPLSFC
jgi:hypothetical protein